MASNLDNTLGVLYNSTIVSSALYGVGCTQIWFYFRKYKKKDPLFVRALVGVLWIFDTCQQAILSACVYRYLVTFHDEAAIRAVLIKNSTLIIEIFFSNLIAITVQSFYCWRIFRISNSYPIAIFVASVSWASFTALIVYCVKALKFGTFLELAQISALSKACNIMAAAADVLISVTLIWILRSSKTGFKRSTDMINRLMVFTFNTGLPTSFCAVMACICISVWPDTFWYIFFFLQLGRFYTNSFMVTLNSRMYIRSFSEKGSESYSLQDIRPAASGGGQAPNQHLAIRIDTMTQDDVETPDEEAGKHKAEVV